MRRRINGRIKGYIWSRRCSKWDQKSNHDSQEHGAREYEWFAFFGKNTPNVNQYKKIKNPVSSLDLNN